MPNLLSLFNAQGKDHCEYTQETLLSRQGDMTWWHSNAYGDSAKIP